MSRSYGLFDRPEAWVAAFAERLASYDKLVDSQRARLSQLEAERDAALEQFKRACVEEIKNADALLFEVAPIAPHDVDAIPTRRAAYSDRTAALLAKLAMLAYIDWDDNAKRAVLEGTLRRGRAVPFETVSAGGTDAVVAETDKFVVVAFRGTSSRYDVLTDLNIFVQRVNVGERAVKVHRGFYDAFQNIERQLRERLVAQNPGLPIYLTGHSLGGALALVAAAAYGGTDELGDRIAAVYTFGAPRVGGADFPVIVKAPHYRVVNRGDVVPLVPPNWISGYRHTGMPILLKKDSDKPIRTRPWSSALLLVLGSLLLWPFVRRLRRRQAHEASLYVARLERIARYRGRWT
ncbi:MAG: lipase family protein [Hyphomicrobiaceae bacterium]|nr:lipase family protein [Hyphomicrobiaceae bacterium]